MARNLRIGISGWTYPPWRGGFYPADLVQRLELEFASRQVNSIEINGSFYGLQKPASYQSWYERTPEGFLFSVKGNRFITHIRRLRDVKEPLARFFASGVLELKEKLGPFLWQLPPSLRYDKEKLAEFFELLPRTAGEATTLARSLREHGDAEIPDPAKPSAKLRHALEVRHASFETPEFIELLREHRIALVVADTAGKWPYVEDVTADFIYVRLHGDEEIYVSGYTSEALDRWERKIRRWQEGGTPQDAKRLTPAPPLRKSGREVFVYFDNDVKTRAPFDAISLSERLGLPPPVPLPPEVS